VHVLGKPTLRRGYIGGVAVSVLAVAAARPLGVRSWVEAIPLRAAADLIAVSRVSEFLLAVLVAWLLAAYLVAPVIAWLVTYSLANGVLASIICAPAGLVLGLASWLSWRDNSRPVLFVLTSALVLTLAVVLGFSAAARIPLKIRFGSGSAS
jgi:hypothetical protein